MPPFLRRDGGAVERLGAAGGMPVRIMDDAVHTSAVVDLGSGDELLIVTDGITEAMDPLQNLFGETRVAELLGRRVSNEPALLDHLLAQMRAFEAGAPQSDDIAAILLKLGADGHDG
jgi:sigma-B regulation protein RsbU (phosphoserine phosphatase)